MIRYFPMKPEEIRELTERAGNGDRAALESLLERYLPQLRAFVRLRAGPLVRARESDSDLVQSVCREVLDHADRFRHPSETAFKRWLYTTALRKIVGRRDFYLAQRRDVMREIRPKESSESQHRAQALLAQYQSFSTPSRKAILKEEVERVESAFETLSEEQREVITLAYIVGLPRNEIAAQVGKNDGAVRMILHRALAKLARQLRDGEE